MCIVIRNQMARFARVFLHTTRCPWTKKDLSIPFCQKTIDVVIEIMNYTLEAATAFS